MYIGTVCHRASKVQRWEQLSIHFHFQLTWVLRLLLESVEECTSMHYCQLSVLLFLQNKCHKDWYADCDFNIVEDMKRLGVFDNKYTSSSSDLADITVEQTIDENMTVNNVDINLFFACNGMESTHFC